VDLGPGVDKSATLDTSSGPRSTQLTIAARANYALRSEHRLLFPPQLPQYSAARFLNTIIASIQVQLRKYKHQTLHKARVDPAM
jgi:hypothetical protein